ncbi:glycosyltransferase family 2 protein [Patescibacteria group bacterium]
MSNKKPLVSVIMPAYNTKKYIAEAIESILNQTYKNIEFIILDDCSTDKTWEIIRSYVKKDSRIVAVRNSKNLNIALCRNKGISLSKGKYIIWADSDDISLPSRIEKQVAFMEKNPKVGICGTYLQSFSVRGELELRKYSLNDSDIRKDIFKYSPVAQPTAIVRRECFKKVGLFDIRFPPAEDLEFSFRLGEHYALANIPEALVKYRVHANSATCSRLKEQINHTLEIRKIYSKSPVYNMFFTDKIAYILTWLAQFLPVRVTLRIFVFLRNIYRVALGYNKDFSK